MSFVTWYAHQFGTWNRTRRIRQSQYLARTDTNTSRIATAMAQQGDNYNMSAIVINMGNPNNPVANTATPDNTASNMASTTIPSGKKTTYEPLFGPNIGLVSSGPSWAVTHEKKVVTDDLTLDVIHGWIEKSKQPSQPTTTLQALVNLKRPTLRLSPLSSDELGSPDPDDSNDQPSSQLHGLEFEYDCDAPKCGIYVHVLVSHDHPEAAATVLPSGYSKVLVFETVTEGGFGKLLKLEEGAILELGRFDHGRKAKPASSSAPAQIRTSPSAEAVSSSTDRIAVASASPPTGGITEVLASANENGENNHQNQRQRKRFSGFPFRKKFSHVRAVSGPALAVVDMGQVEQHTEEPEAGTGPGAGTSAAAGQGGQATTGGRVGRGKKKNSDEGQGVRVLIRLAALDEMKTELMAPNEQVTYLHIVRLGTKDPGVEGGSVEDTRPWVVKVVKREATIGPHTFQLHEIYGLTSSPSAHTSAPTSSLPNQEHSYPPTTPLTGAPVTLAPTVTAGGAEDEAQSECLLCLSAPREVVLLPCRHLVACRECALNMVEFGAGGQITQTTEDSGVVATGENATETATAAATGAEGGGVAGAGTGTEGGTNGTNATRRRRKAKGWYCPVCRQPYTSLLRITTHPVASEKGSTDAEHKNEQEDSEEVHATMGGVQNMNISDRPLGEPEDANEASRIGGLSRVLRLNRRSVNLTGAENV